MKFDPKIVPFDRGADFMHQRALKNKRSNNILDALELMRKAVEASPDNDAYRMDLAELLSEVGCLSQSNQVLLDMIAKGEKHGECLYALAINALNENDPESAKRLLDMCMSLDSGEVRARAKALTGEIEMFETITRPPTRRLERLGFLTDDACDRMRREDYDGARRLFERSLALDGAQRDVRALLSMTLMLLGRRDDALREAGEAAAKPGATIRSLCVAAQVFCMAEQHAFAEGAMLEAAGMEGDPMESRMLMYTFFELGMFAEARDMAVSILRDSPFDRQLMHVAAVSMLKRGDPAADAARMWQRISRIDPADSVANYYSEAALAGTLDPGELTCEYQVPRGEQIKRFKYIAVRLDGDIDRLSREWKREPKFRDTLAWCLTADNPRFREAAVTLLSSIDHPEAESLLRGFLLRPDVGFDMSLRVMAMYKLRGMDVKRIMPPYMAENALMPDAGRVLARMSVGNRQLVRFADDMLIEFYDIYDIDRLAVMWDLYLRKRPSRRDVITDIIPASAALAYCYLLIDGKKPEFGLISRQARCSRRRLEHYADRLRSVLESAAPSDDETYE